MPRSRQFLCYFYCTEPQENKTTVQKRSVSRQTGHRANGSDLMFSFLIFVESMLRINLVTKVSKISRVELKMRN